ncbi:DUF779 domain-containing protein [Nocardia asteroides]|uniref:DUF779 domain-containing protein n=1 Tax=Nocardia asteroides NBRC 15531 TaxID=1110697 RepID=U5E7A1_NOCAS|nr:DUF779 domain-containing protein [Nocardia asteroides]TLF67392.1 DUF779 domain-containing protein [Nocardia asteroides NBRC 15531]UGT51131.1 DUF779 domain-containing protein [Nocardia asteroides]SFM34580.1 hypothetical protein SAMN05444423_102786 [Nocardia asteroides]VEG36000.1 Uncharacterized protein conserved in bacteria [Nocardia asteroides]GAD85837.1 hypothetical protein NCAST_32_03200 [Nocardia asteroides NBRC 15531]
MQNRVHRVEITERAQTLLRRLIEDNGPVLFRQSGDCADEDAAPVCLSAKQFPIEKADVLLGRLSWHTEFWISPELFECWKDTHLTVDAVRGQAGADSLEAGRGMRFVLRARQLTEAENAALAAAPPPRTGADRTL